MSINFFHWVLTRKCQLRCEYCSIVRNPLNLDYPTIRDMIKNEMPYTKVLTWLEKIKEKYPNAFHVFYGGEPLLYEGIHHVVNKCNELNLPYTVISNAIDKNLTDEFLSKVTDIKGFTCSVDPNNFNDDEDRTKKTQTGLETLKYIKEKYPNCDCVAEVTLTSDNYQFVIPTLRKLNESNIWATLVFADFRMNNYYDFSNIPPDKDKLIYKTEEVKELIEMIKKEPNVHMAEIWDLIYDKLPYGICGIDNVKGLVTIDSDGQLRTCLKIRGISVSSLTLDDFFNSKEIWEDKMLEDYSSYCQGCLWPCVYMSKLINDKVYSNSLHE